MIEERYIQMAINIRRTYLKLSNNLNLYGTRAMQIANKLEETVVKVEEIQNSVEEREIEFIIGNTLSGEPIIVKHVIFEKTVFEKSKGKFQKKQKSKTYQKIKAFRSLFNM